MTDYPTRCPVDGCDRGPFDDEQALRGHVNASGGPGHDWQAVKEGLATDPEGGKGGDGSTTDDQPDEGDEGNEGAPEGDEGAPEQGDEQATEGDQGDMPTQDEYEDQHDTSEEQAKAGDGDSDGGTNSQGDTTSGSPLAALPMDPLTLGMLLAVALGIWLAYRAVSGSSDSDQHDTSDEQAKAGDGDSDDATGDGDPSGGLVA